MPCLKKTLFVLAGAAAALAFVPAPAARRLSVACSEVKGPLSGGFKLPFGGEPKDADEAQGLWEEKWAKDRQLREEREARVRARVAGQQAGAAGGAAAAAAAAKAKRAEAEKAKKAEAAKVAAARKAQIAQANAGRAKGEGGGSRRWF